MLYPCLIRQIFKIYFRMEITCLNIFIKLLHHSVVFRIKIEAVFVSLMAKTVLAGNWHCLLYAGQPDRAGYDRIGCKDQANKQKVCVLSQDFIQ